MYTVIRTEASPVNTDDTRTDSGRATACQCLDIMLVIIFNVYLPANITDAICEDGSDSVTVSH